MVERVSSDAEGNYSFAALPASEYGVCARADGRIPACYDAKLLWPTDQIETGAYTPLDVALGQTIGDVDVPLPAAASISGTLVDTFSDLPIASLPINFTLYGLDGQPVLTRTLTTDEAGGYTLSGLVPGDYFLSAGADIEAENLNRGYTYRVFGGAQCLPSCDFDSGTAIAASGATEHVDFGLFPLHVVSGTVRDAVTQQGLPNVRVDACPFFPIRVTATTNTDADGHYTLTHVPGASRIATYHAPAHKDRVWPNSPPDLGYGCVTLAGTPLPGADEVHVGIDLSLPPAAAIAGRVTALEAPGTGLRAQIVVFDASAQQLRWKIATDADGRYTTPNLDPGSYQVGAYLAPAACQFYTSAQCGDWFYDFPLPPADSANVSVVDAQLTSGIDFELRESIFSNDFE